MSTTATDQRATIVHPGTAEPLEMPSGSAFELLADASAAGNAMSVSRLSLTEGADGAKPHYHALSNEMFYILGGTMEFLLADELITIGAGGLLVIPPKMPHAFGAAPGSEADVIVTIAPGVERFGYFRQLQQVALGLAPASSLLPTQERYDVHFTSEEIWRKARTRG
jgi:quercetin dioxygenase-like cupin family protein